MDSLLQEVREEAWNGLIPAEFTMDSSEITSLQRPLPLYLLLPRMGFLACVAEAVSRHFGEVAPEVQRTLWLEETLSGEPLRWHIPTGVLFDLIAGAQTGDGGGREEEADFARNTFLGEAIPSSRSMLPWRITVHFQGCPRRQVFPLENEVDMRRHYTNALKQALFLQLGSSRAGMTLAKENQTRLWHAVKTNDLKVFNEMDALLGEKGLLRLVPVRLLLGDSPPSQLPIPTTRADGKLFTVRDCVSWFCPEFEWERRDSPARSRESTDGGDYSDARDAEVQAVEHDKHTESAVLHDDTSSYRDDGITDGKQAEKTLEGVQGSSSGAMHHGARFPGDVGNLMVLPRVLVQGLDVPLEAPITQLWGALRHPDHFLYIVLRKR